MTTFPKLLPKPILHPCEVMSRLYVAGCLTREVSPATVLGYFGDEWLGVVPMRRVPNGRGQFSACQ